MALVLMCSKKEGFRLKSLGVYIVEGAHGNSRRICEYKKK